MTDSNNYNAGSTGTDDPSLIIHGNDGRQCLGCGLGSDKSKRGFTYTLI